MATWDHESIIQNVERFVRERFNVAPDDPDFNVNTHLFDYGYVDSFGARELILHVEKTFSIAISNSDLARFSMNTLNEIGEFIIRRLQGLH
jgi:methoxymalonate biosynthesis acyl carrier protein